MKTRNGFVTNSSSSSFVLTFNDEKDYEEFRKYCEEYNYDDFYNLIENSRKLEEEYNEKDKNIENALNALYWSYAREYHFDLLDKKFPIMSSKWEDRLKYEKSEEYKKEMEAFLKTTEYYKKKEKIENANILIYEMIWDNHDCAGLLEWAIRNGFVKSEFRKWFICQFNNG